MANMSYCRFENTSIDLEDCVSHMGEETIEAMNLSTHETAAIHRMAELAQEFLDQYDRMMHSI